MKHYYSNYVSSQEAKEIIKLIEEGFAPEGIAQRLGINPKKVYNVYQLYDVKNAPIETDYEKMINIKEDYE